MSLTLSCPVIFPQDVFPVIPGDTDYRMFAEDYGDIPGLDIIFLLGGYYYHTSFDTVDRIVYASFLVYLMVELFLAILHYLVQTSFHRIIFKPDLGACKHVERT